MPKKETIERGLLRAADYTRLSFDPLGTEDATRRQHEQCIERIQREGWEHVASYRDSDLSGYKRVVRPEFERMLIDVRERRLDVVVVWKVDRFSRQPKDIEDFLLLCEQVGGVKLVSVTEPFDTNSPTGLLLLRMMASLGSMESAIKSDRLKNKWADRAVRGQLGPGRRPFGYQADRIHLDEAEASLIRDAYDATLAGTSLNKLVRDWNERGVKTAYGGKWQTITMKDLLLRPRNAGLRAHRTMADRRAGKKNWQCVVADGQWEPIVDHDLYERVVAILTNPDRVIVGRTYQNLLAGVIRCGLCGNRLTVGLNDGKRYYRCMRSDGGCNGIAVRAEPAEDYVGHYVAETVDQANINGRATRPQTGDIDGLEAERGRIRTAMEELATAFGQDDALTMDEWRAARKALSARLEAVRAAIAAATTHVPIPDVSGRLALEWDSLDFDQKRKFVQLHVSEVAVLPAIRSGRPAFNSDRLKVLMAG